MQKIAKFMRVSAPNFAMAMQEEFGVLDADVTEIALPKRATVGSAGYDFYAPVDITLAPGETVKIPTGIRAQIQEGWVLMLFPRSGLGFKYRLQLDNTVGVIDSDYFGAKNEGHIFVKITNDGKTGKALSVKKGEAFCQGVFLPFGITEEDDASAVREGGFGSTTKSDSTTK